MSMLANIFTAAHEQYPTLNASLVLLAIVAPLAAALSLSVAGRLTDGAVRTMTVVGFAIPALIALWLWPSYLLTQPDGGYAFTSRSFTGLQTFGISLYLGLNAIALPMFVLAGLTGLAAALYTLKMGIDRLRLFVVLLLIMQSGLMGVFASIDVFFFYFFHEFALIPTFIMIAIWGRRGRKSVALEMTIYLTLGAMITLAGLLLLYLEAGVSEFTIPALQMAFYEGNLDNWIYVLLLIGFGILVSLFPFHSWAPRGYATAPAPVAMLHAGVLKKFGLYGLIQIALPVLPDAAASWGPLLMWLALANIVVIGLVTVAQRDLKLMLGNASVMHMGYAFLGLYAFSVIGVGGAILMMFAHGLSVALLFMLADGIERRCGTLDMPSMGGLAQKAPVLMAFFVAATMASIGLPGFANFWGELAIFVSLWKSEAPWVLIPAILGIVISAIYGLRAVASIFYGDSPAQPIQGGDLSKTEKLAGVVLLVGLLVVGFWPRSFSDAIHQSLVDSPFAAYEVQHVHTFED
ncbi:MAG: NADH-quinone oxidoreductase subunit M [Verrucomicrobia bacterium]|nr:NADH-quinone oxidoreductase subunit M [Verrucomicrobiota bacterium]